jgi:hypothetical protein
MGINAASAGLDKLHNPGLPDAHYRLGVQVDGTRSMDEVFADIDKALSHVSSEHSSQQLAATA